MLIYRCTYHDRDEGACLSWHGNKRSAEAALRQHVEYSGPSQGPCGVELIEIPTDKAGLLRWLNANFTRDNG